MLNLDMVHDNICIHRSGHLFSSPFLLSRRIGLLFPLSPFPILLRLLWFHFYVRNHCISLGRSLESSATFVRIFRRFLVASSINHVQPAAFVGNVETIVGPSVGHLGPSTASVIIRLRRLRTWENVESVVRMAILEPPHCPVPITRLVVRVRSSPASCWCIRRRSQNSYSHDNPVHIPILSKRASNLARIISHRL